MLAAHTQILENKVCPADYLCVQSNSCYLLASLTIPQDFILNVFLALRTWIRRKLIGECDRIITCSYKVKSDSKSELGNAINTTHSKLNVGKR